MRFSFILSNKSPFVSLVLVTLKKPSQSSKKLQSFLRKSKDLMTTKRQKKKI